VYNVQLCTLTTSNQHFKSQNRVHYNHDITTLASAHITFLFYRFWALTKQRFTELSTGKSTLSNENYW